MTNSATNFIATFRDRCDSYDNAVFGPIDTTGFWEWQMSDQQQKENREGGDAHSFKRPGNLAYAVAYLTFMMNMHFNVAYLIDLDSDPKVILLKAWAPGSVEQSWINTEGLGMKHVPSDNVIEEKFAAAEGHIALTYGGVRDLILTPQWHQWKNEIFHKGMSLDLRKLSHPLHNFRDHDFDDLDLSYGYFEMAEFTESTFRNARLEGINFRGAYLLYADLSNANLSDSNLHRANLRGATLIGANLQGADLSNANLEGADLTSADLSGAKLSGAVFVNSNLSAANLSGCNVHGISAWNVNLKDTIQTNLVITDPSDSEVTVDNLAMAQMRTL